MTVSNDILNKAFCDRVLASTNSLYEYLEETEPFYLYESNEDSSVEHNSDSQDNQYVVIVKNVIHMAGYCECKTISSGVIDTEAGKLISEKLRILSSQKYALSMSVKRRIDSASSISSTGNLETHNLYEPYSLKQMKQILDPPRMKTIPDKAQDIIIAWLKEHYLEQK